MFKLFFSESNKNESIHVHKDPICGMKATDEITYAYKGKVYGFCSESCRGQFEKEPEKYNE